MVECRAVQQATKKKIRIAWDVRIVLKCLNVSIAPDTKKCLSVRANTSCIWLMSVQQTSRIRNATEKRTLTKHTFENTVKLSLPFWRQHFIDLHISEHRWIPYNTTALYATWTTDKLSMEADGQSKNSTTITGLKMEHTSGTKPTATWLNSTHSSMHPRTVRGHHM